MSDILANVFASDLFSVTSLTAAVNRMPHVPGQAGQSGIFEVSGVPTTSIVIEEQDGIVKLISNTARGAPGNKLTQGRRQARSLIIPHFPTEWSLAADQMQNVRAFGSGSQLQGIEALRDQAMQSHISSLSATIEYGRIGAIKGVIYDADGTTVLFNLFTEFGVSQDTTHNFALTTSSTVVRTKCTAVARNMEAALGASMYTGIQAFVGKSFFDALVDHPNVTKTYEGWQAAQDLRNKSPRDGFPFGGIMWTEYRGAVTGSGGSAVSFVGDNDGYAFPTGVPGLFKTNFGPADYLETVNTPGLPFYSKAKVKDYEKGIEGEMQTNPISYCTRPKVLQKLVMA